MFDYHLHSLYSFDGSAQLSDIIETSVSLGLKSICITDHLDFDEAYQPDQLLNIDAYSSDIARVRNIYKNHIDISFGVEIGLGDENTFQKALSHIEKSLDHIDFLIGSVHCIQEGDLYFSPEFFSDKTRSQAYSDFLDNALPRILSSDSYNVMGHFDYPAKWAPFSERAMFYQDNPEAFDQIFRHLISHGIGMEINTSVYRTQEEAMWGKDILRRYVDLGGEYVTLGSDAHTPSRIGWRIGDAIELARSAGVRYVASFHERKPMMYRLDDRCLFF